MMKTKMRGLKKEGSEALPLFLSAGTLPSLSHRWTEGDIFQQESSGYNTDLSSPVIARKANIF